MSQLKILTMGAEVVDRTPTREEIDALSSRRTLVVLPMNDKAGDDPTVEKCQTTQEAFSKYHPTLELEVETPEGGRESQTIGFEKIDDFAPQEVCLRTPALARQLEEIAILRDLRHHLIESPTLISQIDKSEGRQRLIACLRVTLKALER